MKKSVMLLMLASVCIGINAQEAIPSSGGNASGNGGSMSFTAGQAVYTAYIGATGFITQGIQQVFSINVVNSLNDAEDITLLVIAYPNPVTDYLTLQTDNMETSGLAYQLFDLSGRLLQHAREEKSKTIVDMGDLSPATYLLKVILNNTTVKTFRIIKQ